MERDAYRQMQEQQSSHWWFVARRKILGSIMEQMNLPADAEILEAGCGPGGNFELLAAHGTLCAFDMDSDTVAYCNERFAVDCREGSLPDQNPFRDSHRFDLVAALDVLEHVDEDIASLHSLASCLKPGGRMLIAVPAYQWLFSAHDRFHHHKRRYNLRSLRRAATAAGLEIEKTSYYNALLFPVIAIARLWQRIRQAPPRNDATILNRFLNGILSRIFTSEVRLLRHMRLPFGISLYMTAILPNVTEHD